MNWYLFWKLTHILGALGFLAAHGATAAVAVRLRKEREPERIRPLLDLSRATRSWMYVSLLVLVAAGVANGFVAHHWGEGWIWISIGLLTALLVVAFPLAVPYYRRIRLAVAPGSKVRREELAKLLSSSRPLVIAWVETAGILVIVWLMVYRPF